MESYVNYHSLRDIEDFIKKISPKSTIGIDKRKTPYVFEKICTENLLSYKYLEDPCLYPKAQKNNIELENSTDPGLFKNDFEKKLYKKIQEIRKYFTSLGSREDCKKTLEVLADAKTDVSNFFDNVIVNDEDEAIKKNRLELMQLLCKTFNNYLNFSNIESA